MRQAIALLVLLSGLAPVAAGCGGGNSDKKANEAYANSVCTAIGSWTNQVKTIATDVSGGISQASLQKKLSQFESATNNLVTEIKAVPAPNTSEGQTAKKQLDALANQVQATTSAAKAAVAKLPANATVAQTVSALSSLVPQLQTLQTTAQSTLDALRNAKGSLASAFQSTKACKNLQR